MSHMRISIVCLLSVLAVGAEKACDAEDATTCRGAQDDDEVQLLQTNLKVKQAGAQAEVPQPSLPTRAGVFSSEPLGRFEELSSEVQQGGACAVAGRWTDGLGPIVTFKASQAEVSLAVEGLPALTVHYTNDTANRRVHHVQVGDATAATEEEFASTGIQQGIHALLNSSIAAGRGKVLSSKLGNAGLDGGRAPCMFAFHMILATLAKLHEKKSLEESAAAAAAASGAASSDGTAEHAALLSRAEATLLPWNAYYGSSTDAECPLDGAVNWRCRYESYYYWGSTGPWITPPDPRLSEYSWYGNIICEPTRSGTKVLDECIGLCGSFCDCWEYACGSNYGCGYNPWCCAHDFACENKLSAACLDISAAYDACSNAGLAQLNR